MNTTYFVDSETGSDSNSGTSPDSAWRTLHRASDEWLEAGDKVILKSGQTFKGPLSICDACAGAPDARIEFTTSGAEPATIDAGRGTGILLDGAQYVTISNFRVIGAGTTEGNEGIGIEVRTTKFATLRNIEVTGFRISGIRTGGGIGTRLERIYAYRNGGAGISVIGGRPGMPRSRDVYVGFCRAEENRGDPKSSKIHSGNGIVIGGVDGATIEFCVASNNGGETSRDATGPVGIWAWNSDRVIVQNCMSFQNHCDKGDGGGFDFDGGVTNSVMQYNLSYHNDGCGFLLCQYAGAQPWKNNIVRFNISINDGLKNHQAGIAIWSANAKFTEGYIYNNTVVNSENAVNFVSEAPGFQFSNNVFYTTEAPIRGDSHSAKFVGNYYARQNPIAVDARKMPSARTWEEWTVEQGQETVDGRALPKMESHRLQVPSVADMPHRLEDVELMRQVALVPSVAAVIPIENPGDRDFTGRPLPNQPFIGAIAP